MGGELMRTLGPTFAPLLAGGAKAAAIWFLIANMFMARCSRWPARRARCHSCPRTGCSRASWALRNRRDVPWVATVLTASLAIGAPAIGVPTWMIAAANFTYLIGISLPIVAVMLLRRDEPDARAALSRAARHDRARRRGRLSLAVATLLGFQQFGLPTVLLVLALAYAGAALYAWRRSGPPPRRACRCRTARWTSSSPARCCGLALDGGGYLLADRSSPPATPR